MSTQSTSQMLAILLLTILPLAQALKCYDCYGTGPEHKECTKERECHGIACMMFDAGDNRTASAFCLLAMKGQKMDDAKDGCWLEPDGKGKHCMCFTDFCNKLVDRREQEKVDNLTPLLPTAEFLKQNPLVDYDAPNLGQDSDEDDVHRGSHPAPPHVLFPGAAKQDSKTAGGADDDDDLVPVAFEDYKDDDENPEKSEASEVSSTVSSRLPVALPVDPVEEDDESENETANELNTDDGPIEKEPTRQPARAPENRHENEISSMTAAKPPAWVLIFFPMAASWARFVVSF